MKVHFEFHPECLALLPVLSLLSLRCECGGDNGGAVVIGWLMFSVVFHFFPCDDQ
jgi:hypothetical protein